MRAEICLLVDLLGGDLVGHQFTHGVDDLDPTAVVKGDIERQIACCSW
jgi:hypothetical protein